MDVSFNTMNLVKDFLPNILKEAAPTVQGGLLRGVWMMYLNDIDETDDDGDPIGGTHFPQQKLLSHAKKV